MTPKMNKSFNSFELSNIASDITSAYKSETFWFPLETVIGLAVSYSIVMVIGLLGNGVVILLVYRKKVGYPLSPLSIHYKITVL